MVPRGTYNRTVRLYMAGECRSGTLASVVNVCAQSNSFAVDCRSLQRRLHL